MDELRYGVIGTGMMGVEHIENINALDGAVVTAIADPHPASRDAGAAAARGKVQIHADYRSMLDADECDAIVVASPNMTHIEVLRDVLRTDLPVLVEKPMCTTVDDCREVVDMAAQRDAIVWVGLEYRYMPPIARLIDELATGVTGPVRMIAIREHRFPFLVKVGDWNRFNRNTGGTLVEKCCHFFDLMNVLADAAPVRVLASGAQDVNHLDEVYDGQPSDVIDNAFVIVEYDSGVRAMLDLCMFAEATHNQEEISVVGSKGKLEALIPENVLRIGRRGEHWIGEVETTTVRDDSIGYEGQHHGSSFVEHRKFADAIRTGKPAEIGPRDGLLSVAVGVAAQCSIDEGRPVMMSELLG
jgi:predicted dehydrogenase